MIATLIQTIIFLTYIIFIVNKFGIIHSISESWYKLEDKLKPLFTFFCWGIGFPMIWQMKSMLTGVMELSDIFFFLSLIGFIFVGAAAMFKSKGAYTNIIHYAGSVVGIFSALIGLGIQYNLWILLYIGIPLGVIILLLSKFTSKIKHPIFWLEILASIVILIGLWIK